MCSCAHGQKQPELRALEWRAEVAADLKRIYQSSTADEAELHLGGFEAKWDDDYLPVGRSWRRNWARITQFFDFPPEIRKVIFTTNAIKLVSLSLRKIIKNRGSLPSDEVLLELFYLALHNISKKWATSTQEGGVDALYDQLRRQAAPAVTPTPVTQNSAHPRWESAVIAEADLVSQVLARVQHFNGVIGTELLDHLARMDCPATVDVS